METHCFRNRERLDLDAKEILDCIDKLDFRGACLADLAGEMKSGGFKIGILVRGFNERNLIPGSIEISISKDGDSMAVYEQIFGVTFMQTFKDQYPDKESLKEKIAKAKEEIEEKRKAGH